MPSKYGLAGMKRTLTRDEGFTLCGLGEPSAPSAASGGAGRARIGRWALEARSHTHWRGAARVGLLLLHSIGGPPVGDGERPRRARQGQVHGGDPEPVR